MKINKIKFPDTSVLFPDREKYDYCDSYGGTFSDPENKISIIDILNGFSKPLPGWIDNLMSLRDRIVSLFGLKTSEKERRENALNNYQFVEGEKMGFFNFYIRTDNEIILGEDDKHLNFRVSLLLETLSPDTGKKRAIITTVVTYNNWMGSFYFFFVRPFHRIIVPAMLKKDYSHLR